MYIVYSMNNTCSNSYFLDLHLKTLRDDSACPGVCKFIQYMKGCFDALDKKYVRVLVYWSYFYEFIVKVRVYETLDDKKLIMIFQDPWEW